MSEEELDGFVFVVGELETESRGIGRPSRLDDLGLGVTHPR
jgi:hypothetical protein